MVELCFYDVINFIWLFMNMVGCLCNIWLFMDMFGCLCLLLLLFKSLKTMDIMFVMTIEDYL